MWTTALRMTVQREEIDGVGLRRNTPVMVQRYRPAAMEDHEASARQREGQVDRAGRGESGHAEVWS